ncbi:MAG: hypothetical protein IJS81_10480, partial [Selenomonadaceae bacterium]|nr:hypothetical protein [Selenomonadaceae bacterium]
AEGEHSHYNGWKIDLHDGGSGAEGALITDDFHAGTLFNEFVKYGKSLGLGMNFEGEGTSNVHFDVAVDGTQWIGDDAGTNNGGFNGGKIKRTKNPKNISAMPTETSDDGDSVIDGLIKNLLTEKPDETPTFDATQNGKLEKEIYNIFVDDKKNNSEGEDAATFMNFLQDHNMLKDDGTFKNNAKNRELLRQEFREEIQEFGENKVAESYNKFMSSQKSADEKIRSAFEEIVHREEEEGNPDAVKHREILQNGQIGAMTDFLKNAGINLDESQPQIQTAAEEIINPDEAWKKFNPERIQQLAQYLKAQLANAGALDEDLSNGLDNLDENAIDDALKMHRQIVRERPVQEILNGDVETLSDDAKKFRENYLNLQENIKQLESERPYYEEQMQTAQANSDIYSYNGAQMQLADIDKKLSTARANFEKLTPPKNINRVSESDQLQTEIQRHNFTLNGLFRQLEDLKDAKDEKSVSRSNKLKRQARLIRDKLWAAEERYDELNDVGKTWREGKISSAEDFLNLINEGIAQTQRQSDRLKRKSR